MKQVRQMRKSVVWTKTDYGFSAILGAWHCKLIAEVEPHCVEPTDVSSAMLNNMLKAAEAKMPTGFYNMNLIHIPSGKTLYSQAMNFDAAKNFGRLLLCGLWGTK